VLLPLLSIIGSVSNRGVLMKGSRSNNLVLVADDDLFVRKIIKSGLEGLTKFIEVADGKEVEAAYINFEPDVLFLDIHLPHVSGIQILEKIFKFDPDAYVIILSADSTADNVTAAMKLGAKGFMAKPFARDRLLHYFNKCPTVAFKEDVAKLS